MKTQILFVGSHRQALSKRYLEYYNDDKSVMNFSLDYPFSRYVWLNTDYILLPAQIEVEGKVVQGHYIDGCLRNYVTYLQRWDYGRIIVVFKKGEESYVAVEQLIQNVTALGISMVLILTETEMVTGKFDDTDLLKFIATIKKYPILVFYFNPYILQLRFNTSSPASVNYFMDVNLVLMARNILTEKRFWYKPDTFSIQNYVALNAQEYTKIEKIIVANEALQQQYIVSLQEGNEYKTYHLFVN